MIDFAEDIPVFMDAFGEPVTFLSASRFFTSQGIFAVNDAPLIPLDGEKYKPEYTVSCASGDVADINTLYTVDVRGVEYKIRAVTPNPVTDMTDILLVSP